MKIFKDKGLEEELGCDIDLDVVEAGKFKVFEYYILNDGNYDLVDLNISTSSDEIEIVNYPIQLKSKESGKIVLKWTPSITIKKGLKTTIIFKASEIVTP